MNCYLHGAENALENTISVSLGIVEAVTRACSQAYVDGTSLQSSTIRAKSQLIAYMMETVQSLSCDRETRL